MFSLLDQSGLFEYLLPLGVAIRPNYSHSVDLQKRNIPCEQPREIEFPCKEIVCRINSKERMDLGL